MADKISSEASAWSARAESSSSEALEMPRPGMTSSLLIHFLRSALEDDEVAAWTRSLAARNSVDEEALARARGYQL